MIAPLVLNFSGTIVPATAGFPRNSGAFIGFSGAQKADSCVKFSSITAPNVVIDIWLARRTTPELSTSKTGHPAFSNAETRSDFIVPNGCLRTYFPAQQSQPQ